MRVKSLPLQQMSEFSCYGLRGTQSSKSFIFAVLCFTGGGAFLSSFASTMHTAMAWKSVHYTFLGQ